MSSRKNRGFTLVELLVVIVVIGILLAILVPTVGPLLIRTQAFAITAEVNELEGAFEKFKNQFGFYPPSDFNADGDATTDITSDPEDRAAFKAYLRKIAPNHTETDAQIDAWWTQVGQYLDNDSILVFWLSGLNKSAQYPLTYNFGSDNTYGTADDVFTGFAIGEDPAKHVFFDFAQKQSQAGTAPTVGIYLQRGVLETPYLYFNSKNYATDVYPNSNPAGSVRAYVVDGTTVPPSTYFNPTTFQIIAAGVDALFNDGNNATTNWQVQPDLIYDRDNITNFTQGVLEKALKQ